MAARFRAVEAKIRYLTTAEGGRRGPVADGYRGQFHYADEPLDVHDGIQYFPDKPADAVVPLGKTVRAFVDFPIDRWEDYHRYRIRVGTEFNICEGDRVVGKGTVTRVDVASEEVRPFSQP